MADEADCLVVLALLQVAFLGKCDDYGLGLRGLPFSCLPDLVADCCESLDQFCWDVVNSSWFPFLQWLHCSLHFFCLPTSPELRHCASVLPYQPKSTSSRLIAALMTSCLDYWNSVLASLPAEQVGL